MKRILAAYDGSPGADLAIKDTLRGGFPDRAQALVLTIADVWLPPEISAKVLENAAVSAAHEKAAEALRQAKKTAVHGAQLLHGIHPLWVISSSAKADSPAWGILSEARAYEADLILIGSHGRTPLEKFFLGSVSYKVAAEASCSVRVARARERRSETPTRLLIGLDGSADSRLALEEVLSRVWRERTEVFLVSVLDPKLASFLAREEAAAEEQAAPIDARIEQMLRAAAEKFAERGIEAHFQLLEGDPKHAILRHAEKTEADCIFLGARGVNHGERLYLGTVASAVCARARCTVEIVRSRTVTPQSTLG